MELSSHLKECVAAGIPVNRAGRIMHHAYVADHHSGAGNCVCARPEVHDIHVGSIHTGDAEQAKSTGGMIALIPANPEQLAVPGGEPVEDLHLTVTYFGEDVTGLESVEILSFLDGLTPQIGPVDAKVFAFALFNPTGEDPCVTYLVGNNPVLTRLHRTCKDFAMARFPGAAEQHDPWFPHITAGYGLNVSPTYQGPVLFDRLSLHWAGEVFDFPL